MRSLSIGQVQVSVNFHPGFTAIAIISQICLLVFDAPPQTLYKDIVPVSNLPSYAYFGLPFQQQHNRFMVQMPDSPLGPVQAPSR